MLLPTSLGAGGSQLGETDPEKSLSFRRTLIPSPVAWEKGWFLFPASLEHRRLPVLHLHLMYRLTYIPGEEPS